jgi:hypothetical protein
VRRCMRVAVAVGAVVAVILPSTGSVAWAASKPTIVRFPAADIDFGNLNEGPAGDVCPFPVGAVIHARQGRLILFNGQGVGFAGMTTGAITADITNLDTGTTITVNLSGPGWVNGDGVPVLGRGPWVIFEPIAEGGIRLIRGRMRFVPVSYGLHAIPIAGTEQDLCDRVA